jgi:hypothetical protein
MSISLHRSGCFYSRFDRMKRGSIQIICQYRIPSFGRSCRRGNGGRVVVVALLQWLDTCFDRDGFSRRYRLSLVPHVKQRTQEAPRAAQIIQAIVVALIHGRSCGGIPRSRIGGIGGATATAISQIAAALRQIAAALRQIAAIIITATVTEEIVTHF